jgi:hypothetical protein
LELGLNVATSTKGSNTFGKTSIFDSKARMWCPRLWEALVHYCMHGERWLNMIFNVEIEKHFLKKGTYLWI